MIERLSHVEDLEVEFILHLLNVRVYFLVIKLMSMFAQVCVHWLLLLKYYDNFN